MEKKPELLYLKRITTVLITVYILLVLMNLLESIWQASFSFGNGEWYFLIHIKNYEAKLHFIIYVLEYILYFVFLLLANNYVKKKRLGKGTHVLIILLAFLPVVNCLLLYPIWRRLNRQLMVQSGNDEVKSDRIIKAIWILTIIATLYLLTVPLLIYYSSSPEFVSEASYYLRFGALFAKVYHLVLSVIYLLYYLEFRHVPDRINPELHGISESSLLDD